MGKSSITVVLAACLLGLTGCAGNNALDNNRNNLSVKDVRNQSGKLINDTNTGKLRVSAKAARSVERINEVDHAHVIIKNNDAYVAVRLKNAANNQTGTNATTRGYGGAGNTGTMTGRTGTNAGVTGYGDNNMGTTGYSGTTRTTDLTGTGSTGHYGTNTNAGTINNRGPETDIRNNVTGTGSLGSGGAGSVGVPGNIGTTGTPGTSGTTGTNGTPGTTGTTTLHGTNGTNGTTNRNAGTNISDNNRYSEVSTPFEQRVADRVRAADPSIHKVYVSVDPTFYNRMNTYYNDITNGRNRDGLINDFGNTVRRFFR